ncbi:Starch-binding associating with outer membrane [Niabella drilacis]|uniref:Starch-binding associating with outer membrane n=2 Tax=Niabella drilacis (strain DSM 25811 / CCM 8410 / CCUG 62505 / LMG 26954 / E90) TaxID=1285928 RepID=A0A1G6JGD1_NIADE|nr:Starch-binding associating with outer membrane [Niabella drilacis]
MQTIMNRTYMKYFHALLAVYLLASCTKMPEYADGRVSYEEVFDSYKKTAGYLNLCYTKIQPYGSSYAGGGFLAGYSDEAYQASEINNSMEQQWHRGLLTPFFNPVESGNSNNTNWWTGNFEGIRYCNVFLENIDSAAVASQTIRAGYKAQARLLRAFYYLQLIKRYGGVPVYTKPLPVNYDYSGEKRPSFSEVALFIIEECDDVLKNVPDAAMGWIQGETEFQRGMFYKAVAAVLKSQAALYAASPLWNDGSVTWEMAAGYTREALTICLQNGFKLYDVTPPVTNGYDAFDIYFRTRSDVNRVRDKETIFELNQRLQVYNYNGLPFTAGIVSSGDNPSQELVDAFETIDGQPVLDPARPYLDNDHLQPNYNSANTLYNPADPFAKRDPRLRASIYYHGAAFNLGSAGSKVTMDANGNAPISATDIRNTRTGYYLRKFSNFTSDRNSNNDGFFKLYRLAELYLNFAEAANEAASGSAPQEAIDAVNAVRIRAGMPALPQALSKEAMRLRIRNERRIELAWEEHRFYDLRRWKILNDNGKVVTGMRPVANGSGGFTYQRFLVKNDRAAFADKYLIFPLPANEVTKLQKITGDNWQNPGW